MKDFYKLRIKSFSLIAYNLIKITLTDDSEYTANIDSFKDVYCYPNETEWSQAFIGEFKADIEWPNGFGIHIDQIAGLALKQNMCAYAVSVTVDLFITKSIIKFYIFIF
jgi:hypothetical protein